MADRNGMTDIAAGLVRHALIYPWLASLMLAMIGLMVPLLLRRPAMLVSVAPWLTLAALPGMMAGMASVLGLPAVPPRGSLDKLLVLVPLMAIAGIVVQRLADRRRHSNAMPIRLAVMVAVLLAVAWIAMPVLSRGDPVAVVLSLLAGLAGWSLLLPPAGRPGPLAARDLVILFFWYAVGLAGSVYFGASSAMALLAGSIAAGLAGLLPAIWPRPRLGGAVLLAVWPGGVLAGCTAMAWLYTAAPALSLALLMLVFAAPSVTDRLAARFPVMYRPAAAPWVLAGLCAVPAGAAIAWARLDQGPPLY